MATNLIIIEAKRAGAIDLADGQIAAYMGERPNSNPSYVTSDADDCKGWYTVEGSNCTKPIRLFMVSSRMGMRFGFGVLITPVV